MDPHYRAAWYNVDPDCDKEFEILKYVFENVAKLREETRTFVNYSSSKRKEIIMQMVLSSNIYVSLTYGRYKLTLLHLIVHAHDFSIPELCSLKNFDVNALSSRGYTVLFIAISSECVNTVELLLDIGADPNVENGSFVLPLECAFLWLDQTATTKAIIMLLLQYGADVERVVGAAPINGLNRPPTMFDFLTKKRYSMFLEPVLAHVALLKSTGHPIKTITTNRINSDSRVRDQFDLCMQQLESMKAIVVYKAITLYDILTATDREILLHSMDGEFNLKLNNAFGKIELYSYFFDMMHRRTAKANIKVKGMENIARIFCNKSKLLVDKYHCVVDEIAGYLSFYDFLNLREV